MPPLDAADEPVRVSLKIEDWLTVIVMGALALFTFANVLVRYFTSQSFAWTEEFCCHRTRPPHPHRIFL